MGDGASQPLQHPQHLSKTQRPEGSVFEALPRQGLALASHAGLEPTFPDRESSVLGQLDEWD